TVESVCADLRTFLPVRKRPVGSVRTFQAAKGPLESFEVATEDYGAMMLRFRGGASGLASVSQVTAGRKNCLQFEVAGSKASLSWNSERPNELLIGRRERPNEMLLKDPALLAPATQRFTSFPGGHNEGFPDTFKQLFRAVYEYIEAGDWSAPRPFPDFH